MPGVPFTITGQAFVGTTVTINAKTNADGEILLENLLAGNYTIQELNSDLTAGYVLSSEVTITVAADAVAELTIHNKLMRGDLRIIKTFEGKETPVAGVQFTVTGKKYSEVFVTDENGCITIEGLLAGEYTVQEISSDLTEGYVLSEEQAAAVAHEQITEMKIDNKLIRGHVKLTKTDKGNGAKLAGAVFDLFAPDGTQMGVYITDYNGELLIQNLPYGFGYKLTETQAPDGYKPGKVEFIFDITEDNVTLEYTAVNERGPMPNLPKTGDDSNLVLWFSLLGASLIACGIALLVMFKGKKTAIGPEPPVELQV